MLAALGFSLKAIFVKLAYPYGVDAITLLALRMGFALPVFLWVGLAEHRRASGQLAPWLYQVPATRASPPSVPMRRKLGILRASSSE